MHGFVYRWHDNKHDRFYIGSHWGTEDDGYICSSKWMRHAYQRRKKDFSREILIRVASSREDLLIEEQYWLDTIKKEEMGKRYYNLCLTAGPYWQTKYKKGKHKAPHSIEHRQKISAALRGNSNAKGKPVSLESRQKMSNAKKGKTLSIEHRQNISKGCRGIAKR